MSDFLTNLRERRPQHSQPLPVPEWQTTVRVCRLTVAQKVALNDQFASKPRTAEGMLTTEAATEFATELLAMTLCDAETLNLLFHSPEGRAYLAVEDIDVIQPLADAAIEHNGFGPKKN